MVHIISILNLITLIDNLKDYLESHNIKSLMKNFKAILYLLSFNNRRQLILLLLMMLLMAFIDTLGVASIFPFIAVLTNPDLIETNNFVNKIFKTSKIFGVENNEQFFLVLGVSMILILIISIIIKLFTTFCKYDLQNA